MLATHLFWLWGNLGGTTYSKDDHVILILCVIQGSTCFGSYEEHQTRLEASDIGQEGIKWFERSGY
jgi:hypothetical protein